VIQRRHLIVLGYSGSDDFDIMPCLLKTPFQKGLTWIDHTQQPAQATQKATADLPGLPPYQPYRRAGMGNQMRLLFAESRLKSWELKRTRVQPMNGMVGVASLPHGQKSICVQKLTGEYFLANY
jgi:hypothetical protein